MILMASSASVQAESLENTIISTLQSNPDVRVAISERRVVDEELRRSYSGYLPTVDFNVAYGYESSNNPTTRSAAISGCSHTPTIPCCKRLRQW